MRTLEQIRKDFLSHLERNKDIQPTDSDKTVMAYNKPLTDLMNELEGDYGTFCIYPTEEFLSREEVKLYQEISNCRIW